MEAVFIFAIFILVVWVVILSRIAGDLSKRVVFLEEETIKTKKDALALWRANAEQVKQMGRLAELRVTNVRSVPNVDRR